MEDVMPQESPQDALVPGQKPTPCNQRRAGRRRSAKLEQDTITRPGTDAREHCREVFERPPQEALDWPAEEFCARLKVRLSINGQAYDLDLAPDERLSTVLRQRIGLTGTKEGCLEGECGACTVLLDDKPVNSCLVLAFQAGGREITTIEGLTAPDGGLAELPKSFLQAGAVQCGYCTPGMVVAAEGLLRNNPDPDDNEIRRALAGNLCRCTGYVNIVCAVRLAAAARRAQ